MRVPIGLKELSSVKGLPVTASSRVLAGNVATGVDVVALGKRAQHVAIAGGQARQPEQRQPLRQRDELWLPRSRSQARATRSAGLARSIRSLRRTQSLACQPSALLPSAQARTSSGRCSALRP